MKEHWNELWKQISAFQFDPTFVAKLVSQQRWSHEYTRRVVEEYRRFVLMAMVSEHQVTPSEDVDQVWHLHLISTVSYWEKLHAFLPRKLHHHASKGGKSEDRRMNDQYQETMALYKELFGQPAPKDIWPDPSQRFGKDLKWARVNLVDNWVVPKAIGSKLAIAVVILSVVAFGLGCAPVLAQTVPNFAVPLVIIGIGLIAVVASLINRARPRHGTHTQTYHNDSSGSWTSTGSGCGTGFEPLHQQHGYGNDDSAHGHGHGTGHGHGHDAGSGNGHSGGHDSVSDGNSDSGSNDSGSGCSGGGDSGGGCGGGGCGSGCSS